MLSPDLRGRRIVVTGASTGVGRATALELAVRGADVVLACRTVESAHGAAADIARIAPAGSVELVAIDLGDLASVSHAASEIARRGTIDVLINNAGVGGARGATRDGFELAFGVNFLGHYALTLALLPSMRSGGRIVHLSSGSHFHARGLDFASVLRATRSLTGISEYATSKLCVMLFHHELARRLAGSGIATHAADPGDVASDAWRHVPRLVRGWLTRSMKPPVEGARTPLFCACDPSLAGASGGFYVDARESRPSALSRDVALARELWERSAAWTGLACEAAR